ncbi:MAG: FGGY family carbohydrate kinase [Candidatus Eremiobacteraeota bacterium]|nr:FGGY family carbohydrate kinase [Candidatus Eremiobacteraeota bacterium]
MGSYAASIDIGTSSIKAGVFDDRGGLRGFSRRSYRREFQGSGTVLFDARNLTRQSLMCLREAIEKSGVRPVEIGGCSLSSKRASVIAVDSQGKAMGKGISWQDMSGHEDVAGLRERIDDKAYYGITGLPLNAVFTIGKILSLKRNDPTTYRAASQFIMPGDFILRALGARDFLTDSSQASLTGLLDISSLAWSEVILSLAGIGKEKLPPIVPAGSKAGVVSLSASPLCGLLQGTPLFAGGGDQQCAALGAGVIDPGIAGLSMGTAAVTITPTLAPLLDPLRRLACTAHVIPGRWCIEGLQNAAGGSISWFSSLISGKRPSRHLIESMAAVPPGAGGLLFLPYLDGSAAPHWLADAHGVFTGLSLSHTRGSLLRAVIEGVAFETREILEALQSLALPVEEIRVTGGVGSHYELWGQIMADIGTISLKFTENPHASLYGAALLAFSGMGVFPVLAEKALPVIRCTRTCAPQKDTFTLYQKLFEKFKMTRERLFSP